MLGLWGCSSAPQALPGQGGSSGSAGSAGLSESGGSGGAAGTGGAGGSGGQVAPSGDIPAFPGAEGFGRFTIGGRGGTVCHVTTLADSGPGSLRECVNGHERTVVFDVGGWITLAEPLRISGRNVTLAGQTAPGGGIGVRGRSLTIYGWNIVVRFMRFRRGTIVDQEREDTVGIASSAQNVVIDHCSIGFGIDETFSMPGDEPTGPKNLTVQWTINGYALQAINHSAGSLLTADNTTIHHTLWALNKTRNPRARTAPGAVLDWVNNVIYGWNAAHPYGEEQGWSLDSHPFIMALSGTSGMHTANAVGNYFIGARAAAYAFVGGMNTAEGVPAFNLYFEDNLLDGNANGTLEPSVSDWAMVEQPATALAERLPAPEVTTDNAAQAYDRVLANVGATLPERDEVDTLLLSHVQNQTGVLITTEADLVAEGITNEGYGTLADGTPPPDVDRDGMADAWEDENGLDSADPADGVLDADDDGYTNLEEYLNALVPEG